MMLRRRLSHDLPDKASRTPGSISRTGPLGRFLSVARRAQGLSRDDCERQWIAQRFALRQAIGDVAFRYFRTSAESPGELLVELSRLVRNLGAHELNLHRKILEPLIDARTRSGFNGLQDQFAHLASTLSREQLSVEELLKLQLFFLCFGCASAGLAMRDAARAKSANASSHSPCLDLTLRERAQMELALSADQATTVGQDAWRRSYRFESRSPKPARGDAAFRELIEGADVAVVGPAFVTESELRRISEADVIVRIGGLTHLAESPGAARVDIAYFRSENADAGPNSVTSWLERYRPKIAVFKSRDDLGKYLPSRLAKSPKTLYFSGSPMLIPLIIFDVATASPASVSLFGADLYLTSDPHPGYRGMRPAPYAYWPGFAHHDIFSQRYLFRLMAAATEVRWSDMVRAGMALSDADYARQLEALHAPQFDTQ